MSRVILSKYPDGGSHIVVGWDHPAGGAFWQEFASKQEIAEAEAWLEDNGDGPEFGSTKYYLCERLYETEVKREGGMFPGIPLNELRESMPEDLQPLITDTVMALLFDHAADPESGRIGMSLV